MKQAPLLSALLLTVVLPLLAVEVSPAPKADPQHDQVVVAPTPAAQPKARPSPPPADMADVAYGPHERNKFDFWKAKSDTPTPLLVFIHGGGFFAGDRKSLTDAGTVKSCLQMGISVASIDYRLSSDALYPASMHDGARAVQYLRLHAKEFNIDPNRIGATGGSAGAGLSIWLALHPDLADPKADDPVLRQSSRVCCAVSGQGQCSYDPRWIKENIPGHCWEHVAMSRLFFGKDIGRGLTKEEVLNPSPEMAKLYDDCSAIRFVDKNSPPIYCNGGDTDQLDENSTPGASIHTVLFHRILQKKMREAGATCFVNYVKDAPEVRAQCPSINDFFQRYLVGAEKK